MFLDDAFPRIAKSHNKMCTPQQLWDSIIPIDIQNVYEYFLAHQEEWSDKDKVFQMEGRFPNVRLPWPMCWFEWKDPKGCQFGALFKEIHFDTPQSPKRVITDFNRHTIRHLEKKSGNKGEVVELNKRHDELQDDPIISTLAYGSCYLRIPESSSVVAPQVAAYCHDVNGSMEPDWHYNMDTIRPFSDLTWLGPIWLAVSFLHCKNTLVESKEPAPMKLQKARIKRDKAPLFQFKTLKIGTTKQMLEETRISQGVSLPKALHICRGHFKDFSAGRGLFGKYKGLYWWDMHTRGNEENGIVVKDYQIKPVHWE